MVDEKRCPECGAIIDDETLAICKICGYPLKCNNENKTDTDDANLYANNSVLKTSKSKNKIILTSGIILVILLAIFAALFWFLPLAKSHNNFSLASQYEENLDYETAIKYYSLVISKDENYEEACDKIHDLSFAISTNKFLAKAFIALKNEGYVSSFSSLSDIKVGKSRVSCRISGIGYVVSVTDDEMSDYIATSTRDDITKLYVVKYKARTYYTGTLFRTQMNQISQNTSDLYFSGAEPTDLLTNMNCSLAQQYIDLYLQNGDISILE